MGNRYNLLHGTKTLEPGFRQRKEEIMAFAGSTWGKTAGDREKRKNQRARLKVAQAKYRADIYRDTVQIIVELLARSKHSEKSAVDVAKKFLTSIDLSYNPQVVSSETLSIALRRYLSACRPSLTSRRKFYRVVLAFVETASLSESRSVTQFLSDIELTLQIAKPSATRRTSQTRSRTRTRPSSKGNTISTRPIKDTHTEQCFLLLGCSRDASIEIIKRAYRKKALELHPDTNDRSRLSEDEIKQQEAQFRSLHDAYQRALALVG